MGQCWNTYRAFFSFRGRHKLVRLDCTVLNPFGSEGLGLVESRVMVETRVMIETRVSVETRAMVEIRV